MKKAMTIIAAIIALFTLTTIAFASDGEKDLGLAVWTDGAYIYTADGSGEVCVIPCEPAQTDIGPAVWADENGAVSFYPNESTVFVYNHSTDLSSKDLGPAIMSDDYATYTAGGSDKVYPTVDTAYEICVHENGDYHCACGFCAPCSYWN